MRKLLILTIAILSVATVGCSNINYSKKNVIKTGGEEYVVDSSDLYNVDPIETNSNLEKLNENEQNWLIHMREEEKLARDVYETLGKKWQMNIFINIAKSEQTHTDSIKTLLERYNIQDPVKNDAIGEFNLAEIKQLYNDLIQKGNNSLVDALVVGATIEDLDIFDLDVAIKESSKTDINTVYANLQKGSRNHMRAFIKQINNQGSTYSPSYISEETYNGIISSSQEKGRVQ